MESLSKLAVSRDAAAAVVADAFPGCALATYRELTEGFYNAAYLIELDSGQRYVLKVAPPDTLRVLRYERDIMAAEVAALRLAAAHTTMPVPEVYTFDTSRRLLPSPYMLMTFLPGEPLHHLRPALAPASQAAIDQALGSYMAQLHTVGGPAFGPLAHPSPPDLLWRQVFLGLLGDVLADGREAGVTLPLAPEAIMARAEAWAGALDAVREPRLVHWDLWDGNVFVEPETGRVSGIIDFERALWADPLMEFQFREFAVGDAFAAGYGPNLLDSPEAHRRRTLYNLYLYLIMVIECTYRRYPSDDQERWARERLDETLGSFEF
ncbi:MAG TPA: aminoglycoside phosphotransferase family protein [Roseiflexaceae bacterium]|nr:aminoglycoside phosphotransferase family protein [Roseiflexaceae bacterium]